jgi:hypothetical protein
MENEEKDVVVCPETVVAPTAAEERLQTATKVAADKLAAKRQAMSPAERQARYKLKKQEKTKKENYVFSSQVEPTKPEAKKILEGRGLVNTHVVDTVYRLLIDAAEQNAVPANRFLLANGIKKTLESFDAKEARPLEVIPAEEVSGELSNRSELYSLYDASIAWREELSFDEYLDVRQKCKRDAFYLGKEVLNKDFADCHRQWTDFFPKFDPTGLRPGYTLREAIQWLNKQSEIKNFLMLASRGAFKSSWSHVWVASLILCQPSVRVLLVSEGRDLAKDFIGALRTIFEIVPGQNSRFQNFFPEFTIPMGSGSALSLDCPMAHLRLPQSIESLSADSNAAGRRFDVGLFDDFLSDKSSGNDVQIQSTYNKFLALLKLRETAGLVLVLGTPWNQCDAYAQIIKQAKENPDSSWVYRIDPAFVVKPEARHKLTPARLTSLVEDDIESFLFPERLNWKFLRQEMSSSPSFFMSQNLCIFPKDSDSELRVTFEEADLRARMRPIGSFESTVLTRTVIGLDRAFSISKYADFSCLCVSRLQVKENRQIMAVIDVQMDRVRESELVDMCVKAIIKHEPSLFVLERDKGYESLITAIQRKLMLMGKPSPNFRAVPIPSGGHNANAKAKRVKKLELPIKEGLLWFVSTHAEAVIDQFTKYDGIHDSNSHRKDDLCDCVGLLWQECMPKDMRDIPDAELNAKQKAETEEREERERQAEHRRIAHSVMFDGGSPMPIQPQDPSEPDGRQQPQDPRDAIFGGNGMGINRRRF